MSFATLLAGRLARIALIAPALQRMKRNAVRTAIGIALVTVLGGLGFTYLLIALRHQLEREIGPLWTPLAIGGVLGLAALIAYVALLRTRRAGRVAAAIPSVGMPPELAAPLRNIESTVSKNPLPSIAIALAAGFAAATVLRMVRRPRAGAPRGNSGYGQPPPHPSGAERPAWMREVELRETDRRKGNGRSL